MKNELDITIIGNGVEKIYKKGTKGTYALFTGRFDVDQKGIDLLLASWRYVDFDLVIAGRGEGLGFIQKIIRQFNLEKKVSIRNWVRGKEKIDLYKHAAFATIPSRFETFSMVALEALSFGLPIVSFDIFGLKWLPKGSSIKVKAFDEVAFAKACKKLVACQRMRSEMGQVGVKYARNYTWKNISDKYVKTIERILK